MYSSFNWSVFKIKFNNEGLNSEIAFGFFRLFLYAKQMSGHLFIDTFF
jgi:hypothetical protein